jgi:hypothetical protein
LFDASRWPAFKKLVRASLKGILGQHGVNSMIEPSLELGEERNGLLLSFS